jgi:putative two-component system response regulator
MSNTVPWRILIVDDDEMNRRFLCSFLSRQGYEMSEAFDGMDALAKVKSAPPDLILLDVRMPRLDGIEVARALKGSSETEHIPIIIVSSLADSEERVQALELGVDDFLGKPVDQTELRARVRSLLKVKAYNDHMIHYQHRLEQEVSDRTHQLRQAFEQLRGATEKLKHASLDTIFRLSQAAEYKDEDTGNHIRRIGYVSAAIARQMSMDVDQVEAILYAAPMHDIGKIGIPDRILLKPSKLDPEEWEVMKQHTIIGFRILKDSDSGLIAMAENIALTHHEKWDGSGYPRGMAGDKIPLVGRVTAIADVFDALISKRPYKDPFTVEKSLGIIRESRGKHFDPAVVDAFFSIHDKVMEIQRDWSG